MSLLESLNQFDTNIFMALNGAHSPFFDHFFVFFTSKEVWFPLYLLLVWLIIRKYKMQALWVLIILIIGVIISDQLSGLIKDLVGRMRPSHELSLAGLVHVPGEKGGSFGFYSGHASNSMFLAVIVGMLAKRKRIWALMLLWSLLTCYSRIYVGVHYFFDVLVGAIMGALLGWGLYRLLAVFDSHFQRKRIAMAGRWKAKQYYPLQIALIFITSTLLIVASLL